MEVHRIVLVSGGIGAGGATTFLLNLAGELVRRSVPVLVVSLEYDNPHGSDFSRLRIPLHVEDDRRKIFEDRILCALRVIRDFKPTAVIACLGPLSYEILRYIPPEVTRLGMIQSDFPENYPPVAPYIAFVDGMIGVSRQIQANLRAHPVLGRAPAHFLHYGVVIPEKEGCHKKSSDEPIRILYLGRLCRPQKRVQLFPEILRQLKETDIPFHWTIAGDGPERAWLEKEMVAAPPKATIRFAGAVPYQNVPALLQAHDILLLASDAEGLPVSLLEAMAHGLVPVVSDLQSGIHDVVDSSSGIFVPVNDVEAYARAIVHLHKNRAELEAKSAAAYERVRIDFSVEAMADRWLALLRRALNGGVDWPSRFRVRGPIRDDRRWRYMFPIRQLRRLLKRTSSMHRTG